MAHEETQVKRPLIARAPRKHARITWQDANGSHTFTLIDRTFAGSAPNAPLSIADKTVSRIHAELVQREDGAWIQDLGSRNGTFVSGVRVMGARIPEGARVHLGDTELVVNYATEEEVIAVWAENRFGPLVGKCHVSRRLFAYLAQLAPTESPVLIQGETGTGKELVAQAIHQASPRATKPFVIVDCAALPENLIESELFGHAKGAFTGAVTAREGAFEAADGGTVFLDEIGELPLALQPRLLRVLESGTIRRVGETSRRSVDVRILSATNRDLRTMVNAGAFREDLYFRLAVLPVLVPPLRERLEDIPLLVRHFLGGRQVLSEEETGQLANRPWLGNVRELRNFVHRVDALGTKAALAIPFEGTVSPSSPPGAAPSVPSSTPPVPMTARSHEDLSAPRSEEMRPRTLPSYEGDFKTFREKWIDAGEREYLAKLLERVKRNVPAAAREAGVDRTYLYRLMRKHNL